MLCAFVDSISEVSALLADPVIPLMGTKGAELLLQGGGGGLGGGPCPPCRRPWDLIFNLFTFVVLYVHTLLSPHISITWVI